MAMTDAAVQTAVAEPSAARRARLAEFWYYFSENRGAVIGLVVFVLLVVVAVFAPLIAPHAPNAQYRDAILLPPFWAGRRPLRPSCSAPTRSAATSSRG